MTKASKKWLLSTLACGVILAVGVFITVQVGCLK